MVLNQFYFHCEEILLVRLIYDRICAGFFCVQFLILCYLWRYICVVVAIAVNILA